MSSLNGINKKDYYLRQEIDKVDQFVDDSKVYGVFADFDNNIFTRLGDAVGKTRGADFDDIGPWRRRRCNLTDDGVVLAYVGDENYTEYGKTLVEIKKDGRIFPIGTNVQVMVEQPKFYYKVEPLDLGWVDIRETWGIYNWTASVNAEVELELTVFLGSKSIPPIMIPPKSNIIKVRNLLVEKQADFKLIGWEVNASLYDNWDLTFKYIEGDSTPKGFECKIIYGGTSYIFKKMVNRVLEKTILNKANYFISPINRSGYKLHPAFILEGKEKECVYMSAYLSSPQDINGNYINTGTFENENTKLSSISDIVPLTGYSQNSYRQLGQNRGVGWMTESFSIMCLTQLLFIIEYCSFNIQNNVGQGFFCSSESAAKKIKNGQTKDLKNKTGESYIIEEGASPNNKKISYRGEEDPFGNLQSMVDGIIFKSNAYFADVYIGQYPFKNIIGKEIPQDYDKINFKVHAIISRYIKKFGYDKKFDYVFLATVTEGGNSNLPIGDVQFFSKSINADVNNYYLIIYSKSSGAGSLAGIFATSQAVKEDSWMSQRNCAKIAYVPKGGKAI